LALLLVPGCGQELEPRTGRHERTLRDGSQEVTRVLEAARARLAFLLDRIPVGFEKHYGFRNRVEFGRASAGAPFRVVTLADGDIRLGTYRPLPVGVWRVPVVVDDEHRALVTVARMQGSWRAVEIGAAVLAKDLEHTLGQVGGAPAQRTILRVYPLRSDFLILAHRDARPEEGSIHPLESARRFLGFEVGSSLDADRLVDLLRAYLEGGVR
jgi:hypothetical protein